MKNINRGRRLILLGACVWSFNAFTQITPNRFQQYISDKVLLNSGMLKYPSEVKEFYARFNYQTAWINKENAENLIYLLNVLKLAAVRGLGEKDYQFNYLKAIKNNAVLLQDTNDSLEAEVRITDAAIHFHHDIAYGNTIPDFGYNGLSHLADCRNIPALLAEHISNNSLPLLIAFLSPSLPEISVLENKIKSFHTIMDNSNYKEVTITTNWVSVTNKPLLSKLHQLGIIDSANKTISDSTLKQKVKEAQLQFDLKGDGILGSNLLKELNIPLFERIQQLNLAVNYYRWLYCITVNKPVIVVNIPAAYLRVYHNNEVILEMKMIVGKKSTPTPTLTSTVNEVILYPYWYVPPKIARSELLPYIKQDPGFLDGGNYQLLNLSGEIVDPYSVNWGTFSKSYFPFIIRQATGCDNSLGLLKLDFYNPYGVYLHDTPEKNLFTLNKRYFSHGCMRMEKPMELGHLILKDNKIAIDTLTQKGCLSNQVPLTVHADEHMPVVVWYNPAGVDSTGRVIFHDDIYGKFKWKKYK